MVELVTVKYSKGRMDMGLLNHIWYMKHSWTLYYTIVKLHSANITTLWMYFYNTQSTAREQTTGQDFMWCVQTQNSVQRAGRPAKPEYGQLCNSIDRKRMDFGMQCTQDFQSNNIWRLSLASTSWRQTDAFCSIRCSESRVFCWGLEPPGCVYVYIIVFYETVTYF